MTYRSMLKLTRAWVVHFYDPQNQTSQEFKLSFSVTASSFNRESDVLFGAVNCRRYPPADIGPVNCGRNRAPAASCAECLPQGEEFCEGDCGWWQDQCIHKNREIIVAHPKKNEVVCGGHQAKNCGGCPQGHGASWCNGECRWWKNACIHRDSQLVPLKGGSGFCRSKGIKDGSDRVAVIRFEQRSAETYSGTSVRSKLEMWLTEVLRPDGHCEEISFWPIGSASVWLLLLYKNSKKPSDCGDLCTNKTVPILRRASPRFLSQGIQVGRINCSKHSDLCRDKFGGDLPMPGHQVALRLVDQLSATDLVDPAMFPQPWSREQLVILLDVASRTIETRDKHSKRPQVIRTAATLPDCADNITGAVLPNAQSGKCYCDAIGTKGFCGGTPDAYPRVSPETHLCDCSATTPSRVKANIKCCLKAPLQYMSSEDGSIFRSTCKAKCCGPETCDYFRQPDQQPTLDYANLESAYRCCNCDGCTGYERSSANYRENSPEAAYVTGAANMNSCPGGSFGISDEAGCKLAATSLGLRYKRKGEWEGSPGGCHQNADKQAWYNAHSGSSNSWATLLCKVGLNPIDVLESSTGASSCPKGSASLANMKECKGIAAEKNWVWDGEYSLAAGIHYPKGCSYYIYANIEKRVRWNPDPMGHSGSGSDTLLCKKVQASSRVTHREEL